MKIGIIESQLNGKGGSQRQALGLARELQRMGHRVTVYAIAYDKDNCFPDLLDELHIVHLASPVKKIKAIPCLGPLNYSRYSAQESGAAKKLALLIDKDTEVINAHDRLGFRVAAYAKKYVRPFPSALMMSDILTKRWIAWRRGQFQHKYIPGWRQKFFNRVIDAYEIRRFILPHDAIAVLDHRTRQWVQEYFGRDATVVRSGLDIEAFPDALHSFNGKKPIRLVMAGIFFVHRRYEDAIHAVGALCHKGYDVSLVIAGDHAANGEYAGYYKALSALVKTLQLEDRVIFKGRVSDEELSRLYRESDIYISPNHLQSWGLAVFEAMASGCPVIVSTTAGASEVLTDGQDALLVPPKSPEMIANAIERLITNPDLYQALSKQGRAFVEHNISWCLYAEGMMRVYREAIAQSARALPR